MNSNTNGTEISAGVKEMIFQIAADPEKAMSDAVRLAELADGASITVKFSVRQRRRRPARLTLTVAAQEGGLRIRLPEEAGE